MTVAFPRRIACSALLMLALPAAAHSSYHHGRTRLQFLEFLLFGLTEQAMNLDQGVRSSF